MKKALVVMFDDETKARRAFRALEMLEACGDLSMDGLVVIVKNPDGSVRTTKIGMSGNMTRALAASLAGGIFGVPGGSIGVAVGLIGGAVIGAISHQKRCLGDELDKNIGDALPACKAAVIGDVLEETEESVDARMKTLDGVVFRCTSDQVRSGSAQPDGERNNAIASRMAQVEARMQQRERWIRLLEQEAAIGRAKRAQRQGAGRDELQTRVAEPRH